MQAAFNYRDVEGGNAGGYYSKLWEIKTFKTGSTLQDVKHTWDAGGNLTQRVNVVDSNETENFSYDFLDRLLSVSGAYSESYAYNQLGNMTSKGGQSYTYGTKPHAVTQVGSTAYAYDNNGNMTTRGSQTLTWDVENRPISVNTSPTTSFVYDGDGKRVKKTENNQTTVYVNKYYEKNLTTGDITLYYYLGDRMVALKKAGTLRYVSQDHLTGTSVTSDTSGNLVAKMTYFPYGAVRAATGTIETEIKFTGQRLDSGVDLYYYGARYYDANIGRFISADSVVPSLRNPQSLNRYSYALNNPLRYIDPSGNQGRDVSVSWDFGYGSVNVSSTVLDVQDWMGGGSFASQYPEVAAALESALAAQGVTDGSHTVPTASDNSDGVDTLPTTQNPNTIIANGSSAAPALPGGATAGVGTTTYAPTSGIPLTSGTNTSHAGDVGNIGNVNTGEFAVGWLLVEIGSVWTMAGVASLPLPPLAAALEIVAAVHYGFGVYFIVRSVR